MRRPVASFTHARNRALTLRTTPDTPRKPASRAPWDWRACCFRPLLTFAHRRGREVTVGARNSIITAAVALSYTLAASQVQARCGDFDADGRVTASDALGILRTAVGYA